MTLKKPAGISTNGYSEQLDGSVDSIDLGGLNSSGNYLEVEGGSPAPKIGYNHETDQWEYSNDGVNFTPLVNSHANLSNLSFDTSGHTGFRRSYNVRQATTDITAVRGDFIEADTTSGNIIVTLPTLGTADAGATVDVVKTASANTVSFSQNINGGSPTLTIQWESMNLIWTGTQYITRVY
jgi:hypothetical protein